MRKSEQKKLIDLLDVVRRGMRSITDEALAADTVLSIMDECQSALETLKKVICASAAEGRRETYKNIFDSALDGVHIIRKLLAERKPELTEHFEKFFCDIEQLKGELRSGREIQYIVLFLPYKASMWDSMESVWREAKKDTRCITYVAPIPYFERNADRTLGNMHYEGSLMPDYVETVDCTRLNMQELEPDVVYIHNPYDQYNHVTSVHPAFYASELKKYTKLLVYVPYYISGSYPSIESAAVFFQTAGMFLSDLIIAQSEVQKKLLVINGIKKEKIAVLGSPKFDYVIQHKETSRIPDAWKEKLHGKKVFLVCNSIGPFLSDDNAVVVYELLIDSLIRRYHAAVIYRPHPLLEITIQTMRPQRYVQYMDFLDRYRDNDSFVFDDSGDFLGASCASDGMISDYSSLCFSYAALGKPVAMTFRGGLPSDDMYYALDYRGMDFIDVSGCLDQNNVPGAFELFAESILNETDLKKEKRMKRMRDSVVNLDGTCGMKVHRHVMKCLENECFEFVHKDE